MTSKWTNYEQKSMLEPPHFLHRSRNFYKPNLLYWRCYCIFISINNLWVWIWELKDTVETKGWIPFSISREVWDCLNQFLNEELRPSCDLNFLSIKHLEELVCKMAPSKWKIVLEFWRAKDGFKMVKKKMDWLLKTWPWLQI